MHQRMHGTDNRTRSSTLRGVHMHAYTIYIYMIDARLTAEHLLLVMTTKCRKQLLLPLASICQDPPYLPILRRKCELIGAAARY